MAQVIQSAIDSLMQLTGFDRVLKQELLTQNKMSGLLADVNDGLSAEMSAIERSLSEYSMLTRVSRERSVRYRDYEAMDDYGDVSVALDIYAEEATQVDLIKEKNIWLTGDEQVTSIVAELFRRLRIRDLLWGLARSISKYGDVFTKLNLSASGVDSILFIPPRVVTRIGKDINTIKMFKLDDIKHVSPRKDGTFLPWEMVHFRILSFGYSHLYGCSLLEAARKRWLHLKLIEDSVSIYRLNRAVERIVYYIDVGSQAPTEALRTVQRFKQAFGKKKKYLNPNSTEFELNYDPNNIHEDIFYPISENDRSRIEKLPAPPEQGRLQDLEHFSNKLYVALGIPRDYITGETSGSWNSREALSLQDVRFSRKITRIQLAILDGLERIARIHLALVFRNAEAAATANFRIHLADVSAIARQQYETIIIQRVQLIQELNGLAQSLQLNREMWLREILPKYFPDISPDFWQAVIIPDKALMRAASDPMFSGVMGGGAAPAAQPKPKPKAKPEEKKKKAVEDVVAAIKGRLEEAEKETPGVVPKMSNDVISEAVLAQAIEHFIEEKEEA